jgi:hypothetical protein
VNWYLYADGNPVNKVDAVFQVTVSTAPLAAIAPGGWRAALAIVGATSAAIGIVLWASEVFGGND